MAELLVELDPSAVTRLIRQQSCDSRRLSRAKASLGVHRFSPQARWGVQPQRDQLGL